MGRAGLLDGEWRGEIRSTMSKHVGVLRSPEGLAIAAERLERLCEKVSPDVPSTRGSLEATNMLTVAVAVVAAARARLESRGCHRRTDVTVSRDEWQRHQIVRLVDGEIGVQ